jgi:hypothetical protein
VPAMLAIRDERGIMPLGFKNPSSARSSVGQSIGFLNRRSQVRVLPGAVSKTALALSPGRFLHGRAWVMEGSGVMFASKLLPSARRMHPWTQRFRRCLAGFRQVIIPHRDVELHCRLDVLVAGWFLNHRGGAASGPSWRCRITVDRGG